MLILADSTNKVALREYFSPSIVPTKYRCWQHKHLAFVNKGLLMTVEMSNFSIEHILYGKKSSGNEEAIVSSERHLFFSAHSSVGEKGGSVTHDSAATSASELARLYCLLKPQVQAQYDCMIVAC